MENASKALIIAGAILISILLISLGIILINSGSDVTGTAATQMSSSKIQSFNSAFTAYEGTKKGSEIKALASVVNASNASDESHQVLLSGSGVASISSLKANKTYEVKIHYAGKDIGKDDWTMQGNTALLTTVTEIKSGDSEPGYVVEIEISDSTTEEEEE